MTITLNATYRTKHGLWTVTAINDNGTMDATKDGNGIRARLWLPDFLGWDIELVPGPTATTNPCGNF